MEGSCRRGGQGQGWVEQAGACPLGERWGTLAFPLSEMGTVVGSEQRKDRPALTQEFTGTLLRLQDLQPGGGRTGWETDRRGGDCSSSGK